VIKIKNDEYSGYLVTSTEKDNLPITSTKVSKQPCMDPYAVTTMYTNFLDLNDVTECPLDRSTD